MAWFHRFINVFRSEGQRAAIDEELRYHIESRIDANVRSGMSPKEARADALRRFGNPTVTIEKSRDADIFVWLETILQDVRYGARNLRSNPGVTAISLLSLALTIGASTAIFSVVDAVLLRALPYPEPSRIVVVPMMSTLNGSSVNMSVPNFLDLKNTSHAFERLAMYREADASFLIDGQSDWIDFTWVYGDFFETLGRNPVLGRVLNADNEAVIGYALWQSRFGGSKNVIGRTVNISGINFQIVGVMPEDFNFPSKEFALWVPASALPNWSVRRAGREGGFGTAIGRLKQGVTTEQARAEIDVIQRQLVAAYPKENEERGMTLVPLATQIHGKSVPFLLAILSGSIFAVLLIACANVANLLLARGAVRRREIQLRAALGAGKGRIVRQLLTESTMLAILAGALGLPIAMWGIRAAVALAPNAIERLEEAHIDLRVLVFTFGLSLATSIVFGLAPAVRMSQGVASTRQTGGVDSRGLRRIFAIAEVALAVLLLTVAGLLVRSFQAVQSIDPGFRTSHVLTGKLRFRNTLPRAQRAALYRETLARIREAPEVSAVGGISTMFYSGDDGKFGLRAVEGGISESRAQWTAMTWCTVAGDYFQAMGVALVRGRFFNQWDTKDSTPVVLINETMARRYWPGVDPIGKGLKGFDPRGHNDEWVRVIGIVKDMRDRGTDRAPMAQIFETQAQSLDETEDLVVRTEASPEAIRHAIRSVDKTAVWLNVATLDDRIREQTAPRRFQTVLVSVFAVLAFALAGAGVFGIMHYSVAQRTQEIGIRMAMGARSTDVIRMVMREGLLLVAAGVAIGFAGSLAAARSIRSLLFEVAPADPVTLAAVFVMLVSLALLASIIPAHRAARVDPMTALRCD